MTLIFVLLGISGALLVFSIIASIAERELTAQLFNMVSLAIGVIVSFLLIINAISML